MTMLYTNIDGLLSSRLELKDCLKELKPAIVCLTETKLYDAVKLDVDHNYNVWRRDRVGKSGGGIMIMTSKDLVVKRVVYGEGRAEVMHVQVENNKEEMTVAVAYVPPRSGSWTKQEHEGMIEDTLQSLSQVVQGKNRVILTGDFNCKDVDWENLECGGEQETWGVRFLDLMMENMMTQQIKENTRYRGEDEPARLDLVLTRHLQLNDDIKYMCPLGKSDHVTIVVNIEGSRGKMDEAYKGNRPNYRKADTDKLKNHFRNFNWDMLMRARNVQEKYDIFMDAYRVGVSRHVPRYKLRKEGNREWFNGRCARAKERRDTVWKKWKRHRNTRNKEEFKQARNEYMKVRKEEERGYEKGIVEKCKEQPKLLYKFINRKIKPKEPIERLKSEHGMTEDPKSMAELLNTKFQQVFTNELTFEDPQCDEERIHMDKISVSKLEILKLMEELEDGKAMGPDGVSGCILKACREELVEPIYDIIKYSLASGTVPVEWKRAEVVPIYKSGKKDEPLNYRPVSLTSVVCKMCERVFKRQWTEFLERHKLISNKQFGFRKGRSCVTNLLSFYSRVIDKVQERDGWVDCIYLDLKKAFDKVPHARLLWKLEHKGGLTGQALKWMENYLRGREMRTVVRDIKSEWGEVKSGVPQGSVLAPILFLLYINDMPEGVKSYMNLFADDAKMLRHIKDEGDCEILQEDLNKIWRWSKKWQMEFNVDKSQVMEMGSGRRRPTWTYIVEEGKELRKVQREKDLGVTVQSDIQSESHIDRIYRETYNVIKNIGLSFHYMDKEMMRKLVTTIIRPRLEYAQVLWSPYKKKHIRKLERLQRMATKMVPEMKDMTYEERLRAMDLPTLERRRERGDLIQIFKLLNRMDIVDNEDLLMREETDGRSMRGHSMKLRKGRCLKDIKKYSFPQRCVEAWNELSEEVITAKSIHSFKEKLDQYRYGDGTT